MSRQTRCARTSVLSSIFLVALLLMGPAARAQTEGFSLNRFEPAERGSDFFAADSLDLRGSGRFAVGVTGDWAYKPLVAYDADGEELTAPVRYQTFAHVGASVVLVERLRFGVNVPLLVAAKTKDYTVSQGTVTPGDGAGIGDIRLGGDVRLLGEYDDPVSFAVGIRAYLPTGSESQFSGEGQLRLAPGLAVAGQVGAFQYGGRLAFALLRKDADFAGVPFGHTTEFTAGAGIRFWDDAILLGPELFGSTVLSSEGFFDVEATPFEALLGLHYFADSGFRAGIGAGPGLSRGVGAPAARIVASLEWLAPFEEPPPAAEPKDTDGDGIFDDDDACVDEAGEPNDNPRKHGCPPADTDGDGIIDRDDACVDEPGEPNEDKSKHGCPPPNDTDGDGIFDDDDACVDEPGEPNDDPKLNGCPPDSDGDGILDRDDACKDVPGKPNSDPKKHGCPKAKIEGKQVKILERIEFDTAKATIRSESEDILESLLEILESHKEIKKVSVEGHTDNRGAAWFNRRLSKERAKSVVDWLVSHGIDEDRLVWNGFGPDRPIDDNDSDEGRQNNRRVEFHILDMGKSAKTEFKQAD